MKKKDLFLLLTLLWLFNAGIGGWFLYQDFARQTGALHTDPTMLAHLLYIVAAALAAVMTFLQYRKHRND